MGADAKNCSPDAWKREGFHLRLSRGRKAALAKIAEGIAGAPSPTAAVDRAIELALESLEVSEAMAGTADDSEPTASEGNDDGHFASLEAAIEKLSAERVLESGRLRARIDSIGESVERLASLISDALSETAPTEPPMVEQWIEGELAASGVRVRQVAIVVATWAATTRIDSGRVSLEFDVALAGIDGGPATATAAAPARALFGPVDAGSELARSGLLGPIYLACQPEAPGSWRVAAFSKNADGSIGGQIQT